jgi:hypothetical protein
MDRKTISLFTKQFSESLPKHMDNTQLYDMCFDGLKTDNWGYGKKRIGIKIRGSLTDKYVCTGFGYKDKSGVLYVGVRVWIDQGDYCRTIQYKPQFKIIDYFSQLISDFEKINKL